MLTDVFVSIFTVVFALCGRYGSVPAHQIEPMMATGDADALCNYADAPFMHNCTISFGITGFDLFPALSLEAAFTPEWSHSAFGLPMRQHTSPRWHFLTGRIVRYPA